MGWSKSNRGRGADGVDKVNGNGSEWWVLRSTTGGGSCPWKVAGDLINEAERCLAPLFKCVLLTASSERPSTASILLSSMSSSWFMRSRSPFSARCLRVSR